VILMGGHAHRILGLFEMLMTGNWSRLILCLISYTSKFQVVRVLIEWSGRTLSSNGQFDVSSYYEALKGTREVTFP
jgi:hypothetical protein